MQNHTAVELVDTTHHSDGHDSELAPHSNREVDYGNPKSQDGNYLNIVNEDAEGHYTNRTVDMEMPPIPQKALFLSLFLLICGIGFLFAGLCELLLLHIEDKSIIFVCFGFLLSIPGVYYTYQIWLAYRTKDPEERRSILDDIPI
eukprot:TRINITY_DN8320_c0_g1_i1.p2 TRINITY_DN8320_c0_g1~~TRINITY_DN8320_c0_g1_i1.p2  ORF type:complete len:145 (+),score=14.77 TRINITY_DN8320_c0_g1_i1:238-672(+)